MDNIEQLIEVAKLSAKSEYEKSKIEIASIIYNVTKLQSLQESVVQLQNILAHGGVTNEQASYINRLINTNEAEINRLQTSLNNECMEKVLEIIGKGLSGRR